MKRYRVCFELETTSPATASVHRSQIRAVVLNAFNNQQIPFSVALPRDESEPWANPSPLPFNTVIEVEEVR